MPVVGCSVRRLNALLGKSYRSQELYDALDWLGCDVKEIVTVSLHGCPRCGTLSDCLPQEAPPRRCDFCGHQADEPFEPQATDEQIQIDLLPARPDILDLGGLARALKGFLGTELGLPDYPVSPPSTWVDVDPALSRRDSYRPALAAAILEVPPVDAGQLREVMRLQENLHWAIGRGRKLCSIGVYDLATVEPPFRYTVSEPEATSFVPLGRGGDAPWTPRRILEEHPKGVAYASLLTRPEPGFRAYPLLLDSRGQVLSMPPIINSHETRVRIGTRGFFLDVTGLAQELVESCLATLVCSLREMGASRIEAVAVRHPGGSRTTPDLAPRRAGLNIEHTRRTLGLAFSSRDFVRYLRMMRNEVEGEGPDYQVVYPPFRADIKHEVDLMEDVAIAYGFGNIPTPLVRTMTPGLPRPEAQQAAIARATLLGLGYLELLNFMLVDPGQYRRLRQGEPPALVRIANPKTTAQGAFRLELLGGILDTLQRNNNKSVPQRVFEVGLVAEVDPASETGAGERRHVTFASLGPAAGYAEGRSVVDCVARELGWGSLVYREGRHPSYLEGRTAQVLREDGSRAGWLGEVHPEVLLAHELYHPVVAAELWLGASGEPDTPAAGARSPLGDL